MAAISVQAAEVNYAALYADANWRTSVSKLKCQISHPISNYGEAIFYQNAGEHLIFYLHANTPQRAESQGMVMTATPDWHTQPQSNLVTEANFTTGYTPLVLSPPYSTQLLLELESGMSPYMQFPNRMNNNHATRISLSPIRFIEALEAFTQCVHELHPYGFSDLDNTRISFATSSSDLTPASNIKIERIAAYVALDRDIKTIKISGFTDNRASKKTNARLSKKRSDAVAKALKKHGVDGALIKISYYGENRPFTTNQTRRGRALNRSAVIELIKD